MAERSSVGDASTGSMGLEGFKIAAPLMPLPFKNGVAAGNPHAREDLVQTIDWPLILSRVSWPTTVRNEVLVACQRSCCLCHKFCGVRIELHHITPESNGGPSTLDNGIPLCFDCHAEVEHYNVSHPRGTKFSQEELKLHRDKWFARVANTCATPAAPEHQAIDARIATEIHDYMTRDGSYFFLRDDSIKASFRRAPVHSLYELEHRFTNPDFEFFDADLESARARFAFLLSRSAYEVSTNTSPESNDREWSSGKPLYWMDKDEYKAWEERMSSADQTLRDTGVAYVDLYRLVRARLGLDLRF